MSGQHGTLALSSKIKIMEMIKVIVFCFVILCTIAIVVNILAEKYFQERERDKEICRRQEKEIIRRLIQDYKRKTPMHKPYKAAK